MPPTLGINPLFCMKSLFCAGSAENAGDALVLADCEDAVNGWEMDGLDATARPVNLDLVYRGGLAKAEVDPLVIGGHVAAPANDVAALADAVGGEVDGGTNGIARAFRAAD